MRRDRSRQSVVLLPQESPNYHEGGSPIASGIHVALRETRSDVPTYPMIDSISCDGGLAHGPVPTFSASRSALSCKRLTIYLGSMLAHPRGLPSGTLMRRERLTLLVAAMPKRTAAQGRVGPVSRSQ
jgi:hypothetical protein